MQFQWFQEELSGLMPNRDLRLVRDPHRLGFDLWAIERRVPGEAQAAELENLRLHGEQRFHEALSETIGLVRLDLAPPWRVVHICRSATCQVEHNPAQAVMHEPSCYRDPNRGDIESLRRWLYEFRSFEHSMEVLKKESRDRVAAMEESDTEAFAKTLSTAPFMTGRVFSDAPKSAFKESSGGIWLPQSSN